MSGARDGRPGTLHPSGWGHVPVALMRDPRARSEHIDVYSAISSGLKFKSGEGEVRMRRIVERSHRQPRTVRRAEADLASWGYLEVTERSGRPKFYRLLPTARQADLERLERREDAAALDPVATGRIGGKAKAQVLEGPPLQGPGSMRKAPVLEDRTPQRSSSERALVVRQALITTFGYTGQLTRNPKGWLTRAANDIAGAGGVPVEVPARYAQFKELHGRPPARPIDLANAWPALDCERARCARDLRERLAQEYGDDDADLMALDIMRAHPDETDPAELFDRGGGA